MLHQIDRKHIIDETDVRRN